MQARPTHRKTGTRVRKQREDKRDSGSESERESEREREREGLIVVTTNPRVALLREDVSSLPFKEALSILARALYFG